jgi:hypothetical protein
VGRDDLEHDSRNLVTLCRAHHFLLGHFGDWDCYNPHVKFLAIRFFGRPVDEIAEDPEWLRFRDERKRDLRYLSSEDLDELCLKLADRMPRR